MKRLLLSSAIGLAGLFSFGGQAQAACATSYSPAPNSGFNVRQGGGVPVYGVYANVYSNSGSVCNREITSKDWVTPYNYYGGNTQHPYNYFNTGETSESFSVASSDYSGGPHYHVIGSALSSGSSSGSASLNVSQRHRPNNGVKSTAYFASGDALWFEDQGLDAAASDLVTVPFKVCGRSSSDIKAVYQNDGGAGSFSATYGGTGLYSYWANAVEYSPDSVVYNTPTSHNIPSVAGSSNHCITGAFKVKGTRAAFTTMVKASHLGVPSREYFIDVDGVERHVRTRKGTLDLSWKITLPSGMKCFSASGNFPGCGRGRPETIVVAATETETESIDVTKEESGAVTSVVTSSETALGGDGTGRSGGYGLPSGTNAFGGGGQCSANKFAGNPINFALGFKAQGEGDYADGVLSFTRGYRSDSTWTNDVIGARWTHNYNRTFNILDGLSGTDIDVTGQLATIDVTDGSGVTTAFRELSNGDYEAVDIDITSTLEAVTGGYIYTTNADTKEHYDSSGKLTRIEYRGGEAVDLSYDGSDRLSSVTDEEGDSLTFSYNGSDLVSSVVTPVGTFIYGYDGNDNLTSVTKPDSEVRTYHYEDSNHVNALTGITDEKGVRYATYAYDTVGRAVSSEHVGGVDNYTISYNTDGTTTTTNPLGKQTTYSFDTINGVRKIIGVEGHQSTNCAAANKAYAYDDRGFMSSKTDWLGNVTSYTHDDRGLVTSMTEDANGVARTTSYSHELDYRLADVISETGKSTDYDYDAEGRVTSVSVTDTNTSETRTVTYSYHADTMDTNGNTVLGKLASVDGTRGDVTDVTSFTYDSQGRLTKVTNALGHETETTSFDSADRPLTVEDANNVVTTLTYSALGRVASSTTAGALTSYTYDDNGNVLTVTRPNGVTLTYVYDDARRLVSTTDALGNTMSYTHDVAGNVLTTSYKDGGNTLRYSQSQLYDELSRIIESVDANNDSVTTVYDVNSNVTEVRDGNLNATTFAFDGLDRLVNSTDALSGVTSNALNDLDQTTGVTDPRNNTTNYTYNAFGDVLSEISPDRGTVTYTYDAAGNQLTRTDARGETVTYSYDALNRVTSASYASDSSLDQSFTYDASSGCGYGTGRLCSVSDAGGSVDYIYDAQGRLTDVTEMRGALSFTMNYVYDAAGTLTGMVLPSSRIVSYGLNANAQVSSVDADVNSSATSIANTIAYLPFGGVESLSYGNGVSLTNTYNTAYQLTAKQHGSLFYEGYTYDNAGNITVKGSDNYTYDALYRLTDENGGSYSYDAIANRLSDPLSTYNYPSDSSRLSTINGASIATDVAGNLTQDVTRSYGVDAAGHVETITMGGNIVATYTYDANNQRVKKVTSTDTTHYVYGAGGLLYGEYDALGNVVREYVYLNGSPIAQIDGGVAPTGESVSYLHTDHLGTPRIASNTSGSSVWSWDSDAFGNGTPTGSKTVNLRFAGQYWDNESGLHYNWNRYYDPKTGRYVSSDPIGLDGGLNTFAYVGANPVIHTDPEGLRMSTSLGGRGLNVGTSAGSFSITCEPAQCDVIGRQIRELARSAARAAIYSGCMIGRAVIMDSYFTAVDHSICLSYANSQCPPLANTSDDGAKEGGMTAKDWEEIWSDVENPDFDGDGDGDDGQYCRKVKEEAILFCESSLPTADYGVTFFKCINEYMQKKGCR
ncbi:MAG: RHS repeat-associated core domain-containing protein [Alphaproteobacteria bacterium]